MTQAIRIIRIATQGPAGPAGLYPHANWDSGSVPYARSTVLAHNGGVWLALRSTSVEPSGSVSDDWASWLDFSGGFATLDSGGKVPTAQLPASVLGALEYQGTWSATTNSPAIPAAASGNKGYYYKVATAGTTAIDGISEWAIGDWIVSNGATWDKIDNTDQVTSVAGRQGAITLTSGDVGLGNADNTSDANKPVSTAQQTALDLKAALALAAVAKSADYTTLAGDRGKSIDVTTGSSADVTITLLAAATAGAGALQYVAKADSGTKKVIVTDGSNALAWLSAQNDSVLLRCDGANWSVLRLACAPRIDLYLTTATWTKAPGAKRVRGIGVAAGSGAGSGRRGAAGTIRTGGGGASILFDFVAALLSSTVTVTIGAAGAGGAAVSADDTNGNPGALGGALSFGAYAYAGFLANSDITRVAALGGSTTAGTGGGQSAFANTWGGGAFIQTTAGQASNTTGGALATVTNTSAGGQQGGAGGTIPASDVPGTAGTINGPYYLAAQFTTVLAAPVGIGASGANGTGLDADPATGVALAGRGGQGGNAGDASTPAGAGGNGGYGSGGGGGGASFNGQNSGKGGDGGPGYLRVETYF